MTEKTHRRRLDEILIAEGLATESDIIEALLRQKARGGKFGSHVLCLRSIDEAGLVKALAIQFGCKGVVISQRRIAPAVARMIPAKVCIARRVLPFDYDEDTRVLKVACEDPADPDLHRELSFLVPGTEFKLYVAAEVALETAIARYCEGRDVSLADRQLLEIPDQVTDANEGPPTDAPPHGAAVLSTHPGILFVTDELYAAPLLQSLLEREGFHVVIAESADAALIALEECRFQAVFISETVSGDYLNLVDRARRLSPKTLIRFYSGIASLLLGTKSGTADTDLLLANLDLFTSLLAAQRELPDNHGGRVGHYADRLCRRLDLPARDRLLICNAAYVHDLARYYYNTEETQDNRRVIQLTSKLLQSLNYSPVVIAMLRSMYADVAEQYSQRLPIEVLGGNILTLSDIFCDNLSADQRLSHDRFAAISKRLRGLSGKLFLPELVESFITMVQEELLDRRLETRSGEVMILADDPTARRPLELRLQNEGYRTVAESTQGAYSDLYRRREPDVLILVAAGRAEAAGQLVAHVAAAGISYERTPTFVLTDASSTAVLTSLLDCGIEDVLASRDNLDLLVGKLRKLKVRQAARHSRKDRDAEDSGARGRLADMTLIDLLQALGPNRKTVRISVRPNRAEAAQLRIYLNSGVITFAKYGETEGAEAVYEGLTWTDGSWVVEPVTSDILPPPNNQLSNESILMEGCRLLDEKVRAGQLL